MRVVRAFTVLETNDPDNQDKPYWIVPLHDFVVDTDTPFAMELFHSKKDAERFAREHKGKRQ